MFIVFFLWEEIVCFNEKCVVRQLTMKRTSMVRMSTGLGEELGPGADRGTWSALGQWQCQQHKPGEVCSRRAGLLNPAWHSLLEQCPGSVLARSSCPCWLCSPSCGRSPHVSPPVPGCPWVSPRSPGWGTLCPALLWEHKESLGRGTRAVTVAPPGCRGSSGSPDTTQGGRLRLRKS